MALSPTRVTADAPSGTDAGPRPWGILGGTFDPVHLGHTAVAEQAREELGLAGVLFIPAARSPFKPGGPAAPVELRVAMVELAVAGNPAFVVSRLELDRPAPSYTVDTLQELHARGLVAGSAAPDPWLILSMETLPGLVDWHRPDRVLELARVAVVPRRGYAAPTTAWLEERFPGRAGRFRMLLGPDLGHSASDIRARVAAGRSVRYLVPDAVARFIQAHGLYGTPDDDGGR